MKTALFVLAIVASASAFCPNRGSLAGVCGPIIGKKILTCAPKALMGASAAFACMMNGINPNGACSAAVKKCTGMSRRLEQKIRRDFCPNRGSLVGICGPVVGAKILTCAPKALMGASAAFSCLASGMNPNGPCSNALKKCAGLGRRLKKKPARKMFCSNRGSLVGTCGPIVARKVLTCAPKALMGAAAAFSCLASGMNPNGACSNALKKCAGLGRRLEQKIRRDFCPNRGSLAGVCGPIIGKKILTCAPKALMGASAAFACMMNGINPNGACSAAVKKCTGMSRRLEQKIRRDFCPNRGSLVGICGPIVGAKILKCAPSALRGAAAAFSCLSSGMNPNGKCSNALKKCAGF